MELLWVQSESITFQSTFDQNVLPFSYVTHLPCSTHIILGELVTIVAILGETIESRAKGTLL